MDQSKEKKLPPNLEVGEAEETRMENEVESELLEKENKSEMKSESEEDSVDGSDSDSDVSDPEYECKLCNKKFSGFINWKQHERGRKHAKAVSKKKREKKLQNKITGAEEVVEEDEEYLFFIKKPFADCKPCGKHFGDVDSYRSHLVSKAHKQKKIQSSILDQVRQDGKINTDKLKELWENKKAADNPEDLVEDAQERIANLNIKDGDEDEFECKDCEKSFSGLTPYTQHLMSKTHAKKVEQEKLLEKLVAGTSEDQHSGNSKDVSPLVVEDDVLVCKLCSTSFSGPENAMIHLKSKKHSKNLEEQIRKMKRRQKAAAAKQKGSREEDSDDESEDKSDSEAAGDKTEDNVLSETDAHKIKASSAAENMHEENENEDPKDKENNLLAYERYKSYKKVMHQVSEEKKGT